MTSVPVTATASGRHASADVDREPTDLLSPHFDLAGMHVNPDREPDTTQGLMQSAGAADRTTGPVEGGEEAVAGRVDLASAKPRELPPHDGVVLIQ